MEGKDRAQLVRINKAASCDNLAVNRSFRIRCTPGQRANYQRRKNLALIVSNMRRDVADAVLKQIPGHRVAHADRAER
jgi:hypothetical protein